MQLSTLLRPRAAVPALLASGALVLGACGGGEAGAGDTVDPASVVPASAPLYVEAVVQPEGDQRQALEAVARKVAREDDPGAALLRLLDEDDNGDLDFDRDVRPWLGERVGVAVTGVRGTDPEFVLVAQSTDEEQARKALERPKDVRRAGEHAGVELLEQDGSTGAVLDDAVLIGTSAAVKAAIDASKGESLADTDGLRDARAAVGEDGVGFAYVNPRTAFDLVAGAAGGAASAQLPGLDLRAMRDQIVPKGLRAAAASLEVDDDRIVVDGAAVGGAREPLGDPAAALTGVPAGSFAAVGVGDVGAQVERAIGQILALGGGGAGGSGGAGGALPPGLSLDSLNGLAGFDVRRELLSWMGDAAIFVRGSGLQDLGGGLVVQSKDPARSRAAIGRIEQLLRRFGGSDVRARRSGDTLEIAAQGVPLPIRVQADGDRFTVAVGARTPAALRDGTKLADDAAFKDAAGLLTDGVRPSFFLDVPQVVALVGAVAGGDPQFDQVRPFLDAYGPAAAGTRRDGDLTRGQLGVRIR
jgi:hypothetical protein